MLRRGLLTLLATVVLCCCSAQTAEAPDVLDVPEVASAIPFEPKLEPAPAPEPDARKFPAKCFVVAVDKKAGMVVSICFAVLPKTEDPTEDSQRF